MKHSITTNKKYALISTIILLLLWKMLAVIVNKSILIPSPEETFIALIKIISAKNFWLLIGNTMKRVVIGFTYSLVLGVLLGFLSGFIDPIYYLLKPIILIQRSVPTMAIILLAIIWLNGRAPILVGFLVIFPIIYSAVLNGIREIDPKLVEMSKVYHLSFSKRLIHLYIPSIRSALTAVSVAAVSLNLKIIIAAEVLSQPKMSIGTSFQIEKATLNTSGVFAWAIIAIIMGGLLELLVKLLFVRKRR